MTLFSTVMLCSTWSQMRLGSTMEFRSPSGWVASTSLRRRCRAEVRRRRSFFLQESHMDMVYKWDTSMDWFKGKFTGKPHMKWENRLFPVDFPSNQSIEYKTSYNIGILFLLSFERTRSLWYDDCKVEQYTNNYIYIYHIIYGSP